MTTTLDGLTCSSRTLLPFLDREHTIARPAIAAGWCRRRRCAVHLCIGQAYAFSVFNLPMTRLIGVSQSTAADWKLTELGWIFRSRWFFLACLPRSSDAGSRKAAHARRCLPPALCWASAFLICGAWRLPAQSLDHLSAATASCGGCALGIGYISPVSTLMKWFPDRPAWRRAWRSWASAAAH